MHNHLSVFVLLKYGLDAAGYTQRHAHGLEPDRSPYGFHLGERPGWSLTFSRDQRESLLGSLLRRGVAHLLGFDLVHAYRNRRHIARCDIVWTMAEKEWLAVAALWALGVTTAKPMIGNSVWLFDKWKTFSAFHKSIYSWLAQKCSILTVHSSYCLPVGRKLIPRAKMKLQHFGISTETFPLTAPVKPDFKGRKIRVLAMGNDRTRDWDTFLRAFGNQDRFEITLVCRWAPESYREQYRNLTLKRSIPPHAFGSVYDGFDFVVVPMVENIFSGITVMLEAVALGKPVICSDTGGCPAYFDRDEITFVPVGDPDAMRLAVLATDEETAYQRACRAQETFRREDYSTQGMMDRYVELSKNVLDHAAVRNRRAKYPFAFANRGLNFGFPSLD